MIKEIKAIIQPFMLRQVLDALHKIEGGTGVMSSKVRCTNVARGIPNPDINARLELIVADELVEEVLESIQTHARSGQILAPDGGPVA